MSCEQPSEELKERPGKLGLFVVMPMQRLATLCRNLGQRLDLDIFDGKCRLSCPGTIKTFEAEKFCLWKFIIDFTLLEGKIRVPKHLGTAQRIHHPQVLLYQLPDLLSTITWF